MVESSQENKQSAEPVSDKELEKPQADEVTAANERALRAQAELENFRKRSRRELSDIERYAAVPLLRDVLGVVDDIDRAIAAAEKTSDAASLLAGVQMVRDRLRGVLAEHGVRSVEAEGAPFDPAVHEAIMQQPSDEHTPGSVMHVAKPGYLLHERVVRPAQVIVAAKPETDDDSQ